MRNWDCACAPGILGPPQPVMPLVLQRAVETSARSAPLLWSISGCSSSCSAMISWASEPSTTPPTSSLLSSNQLFPAAILNAVDARWASNLSWSVSCAAGILSARLSWSTISSPVPSSPAASDSGYASASSPPPNLSPLRQTRLSFTEVVSSTPNLPKRRTASVASQASTKPDLPPAVNCSSSGTQTNLSSASLSCQTTPSSTAVAACQHESLGVQSVETQSPAPQINKNHSKGIQTSPEPTPAATTCSSSQTELPLCKLCGAEVEPLLDVLHLMHCPGHPTNAQLIGTFLSKWESSCCLPKPALGQFLDLVAIFVNDSHDTPTPLLDLCGPVSDIQEAIFPPDDTPISRAFYHELSEMLTEVICAGTEHLVENPEDCDASAILLYPEINPDDGKSTREVRYLTKQETFSDDEPDPNDDDDLTTDDYEHYDSCCLVDDFDYDVGDY